MNKRIQLQPLNPTKKILIVTEEASGDHHAAALVTEAHKLDPTLQFFGMGGEHMRQAGVEIIIDSKPMAVVGGIEIAQHFWPIFRAWKKLRQVIKKTPPDLVVLLDYPEFNLQIAKAAKKAGIKVLYYISPQVWAWKQRRVKTIRERVNKMLVIFPFEAEFYQRHQVPVEFVGHPLAEKVVATKEKSEVRQKLQIPTHSSVIGLLPGSRKGEIKRLLPSLIASAEMIKKHCPHATFILPLASSLSYADIEPYVQATHVPIHIIREEFYNAMQLCEAAIVTSGTATLETALLGIPMVIVYKASASTYHIVKRIIKIPYIGLCNIVAGQAIVKELIQHEANPKAISEEICRILDDIPYQQGMKQQLALVKQKLGAGGGSMRAAKALVQLLRS